jgi:hypothetical protein
MYQYVDVCHASRTPEFKCDATQMTNADRGQMINGLNKRLRNSIKIKYNLSQLFVLLGHDMVAIVVSFFMLSLNLYLQYITYSISSSHLLIR